MIQQEEIRATLGLNLEGLKTGFQRATVMADEWGKEFKRSINDAGRMLLAPLTGGAVLEGLSKISEKAEQISRLAEGSGLGVEEWQKLAYTFTQAGAGADGAERAMQKLADTIGGAREGQKAEVAIFEKWGIALNNPGGGAKSTTEIIDEIATAMDKESDPTKRAAEAHDMFGKSVMKSVEAMKLWKQTHGEGASIITEDDVNAIKSATSDIRQAVDFVEAKGAHLAGIWAKLWQNIGEATTGKTGHEIAADAATVAKLQGDAAEKERYAAQDAADIKAASDRDAANAAADASADELSRKTAIGELQEKQRLVDKQMHEAARDAAKEEIENRKEALNIMRLQARHAEEQAKRDSPYFHTVDELARVGLRGGAFDTAREVMARQAQLRNYTLFHGIDDSARGEEGIIQNLKSKLEEGGFIAPEQHLEAMKDSLEELVKMGSGPGLKVNPEISE
jgi:hypothetical protein